MSYRTATLFYSVLYSISAIILLFINNSIDVKFSQIVIIDLPILFGISLALSYYLYKATQGRQAQFVNALMLSSMGRLVGFSTVLVTTVFIWRETVVPSAIIVSLLYLASTGADAYFAKRFK